MPRSCSRHSSAEASIMSRTTGDSLPRMRASTSASTSSISSRPRWNSARCHQLCTAKKLPSLQVCGARLEPGHAIAAAILHLHHVRHRVPGPAVALLELDRASAERLGPRVVAGLLQPERVACRAPRGSPGMPGVPGAVGARDAVAQHARVAGEEVDLVARLQRQRSQRVADAQVLEHRARRRASGRRPGARRRGGAPLASVGRQPRAACSASRAGCRPAGSVPSRFR